MTEVQETRVTERQARDNGPGRAETAVRKGSLLMASMYRVALPEEAPFDLRDGLIDKLDSPLPVTKLWTINKSPRLR